MHVKEKESTMQSSAGHGGKSCNLRMWGAQKAHEGVMSSVWNQSVKNRGLSQEKKHSAELRRKSPFPV